MCILLFIFCLVTLCLAWFIFENLTIYRLWVLFLKGLFFASIRFFRVLWIKSQIIIIFLNPISQTMKHVDSSESRNGWRIQDVSLSAAGLALVSGTPAALMESTRIINKRLGGGNSSWYNRGNRGCRHEETTKGYRDAKGQSDLRRHTNCVHWVFWVLDTNC